MTLEDKICKILQDQYHCHCDCTGNLLGEETRLNKPVEGEHLLDFCMAVKRILRLD